MVGNDEILENSDGENPEREKKSGNQIPTAGGSDPLSDSLPAVFIRSARRKTTKVLRARRAAEKLLRSVRQRRSEGADFVCAAANEDFRARGSLVLCLTTSPCKR